MALILITLIRMEMGLLMEVKMILGRIPMILPICRQGN